MARRSKTISTPVKVKKPKRQQFSPEYKLEAVRLSSEGTRTVAAVAADLGIAANQLHRWRRQHAENGVDAFPGSSDDGGASILVATDAAGEGLNMQFCWRMVKL